MAKNPKSRALELRVGGHYKKGFHLTHNQDQGWYGTTGSNFSWYKRKKDAHSRANDLMESYKKKPFGHGK